VEVGVAVVDVEDAAEATESATLTEPQRNRVVEGQLKAGPLHVRPGRQLLLRNKFVRVA
jgi:hypothetical protein